MIIDVHTHAATPDMAPAPFFDGWAHTVEALAPKKVAKFAAAAAAKSPLLTNDPQCKALLAQMDEAGIDKSVLLIIDFGVPAETNFEELVAIHHAHRVLAESVPGRFLCFAGVDPRRGAQGLSLLHDALCEWKFAGLKLYPPCGFSPSDPRLDPFYDLCSQMRVPVLTHIGPTSSWLAFDSARPENVDSAARRFPKLDFILAHAGVVHVEEASLLASYRPNVHLDISAFQQQLGSGLFKRTFADLLARGLARKLLFGTDWPFFRAQGSQKKWVSAIESYQQEKLLTTEQAALLFHENASAILAKR